jgi:hypothetical protein
MFFRSRPPAEEVTLNITYFTFTDSYEEKGRSASRPSNAVESMTEAFENTHPNIKVEMNILDNQLILREFILSVVLWRSQWRCDIV